MNRSERWCAAGASVALLIAGAVIFGWLNKCPAIIQLDPTFAPMKFNTAVGFLASGLAILLYLVRPAAERGSGSRGRRAHGMSACALVASVPLVIGAVTSAEHVLHRRLGIDGLLYHGYTIATHSPLPGQISIISSLCLALLGIAITCLSQQAKGRWLCAAAGILAVVVLVTGFVGLLGYATALSFTYAIGQFTQMALHTATCFVILGTTIALLARDAVSDTRFRFGWGAIAAVVSGVLATIVCWQAIVAQETMHVNAVTDSVAADICRELTNRMHVDADTLGRMAERWRPGDDISGRDWRGDASNYVRDSPEYQAVEWIDPSLHVRWVVPIEGNEFAFASDAAAEDRMRASVRNALAGQRVTVSKSAGLIQGERGYLIDAPILRQGRFVGMIAGVCRVKSLLSAVVPNMLGSYLLEDIDGVEQQPAHRDRSFYSRDMTVSIYGVPWSIRVTPTMATVNRSSSFLPTLVLMSGVLLSLLLGTIIRLMGASRLAAESEREARLLAASLAANSTNLIYVIDLDTRIVTYVNQYAADFVGYSREQLMGTVDYLSTQTVHPDDHELATTRFGRFAALADGEVVEYEQRILHANGEWRWVCCRERVFHRHADGTPSQIMGTGNDISDRRESEEALRDINALLESAIDQSPIGMSIIAPDGRWLRVNDALCAIVGYTREELLARDFLSITHPDDVETDTDAKRQLLAGEICHYSIEKRYLHKGGRVVWIMVSVSLVKGSDGKPAYFVTQIQDVTLRIAAEQQVNDYALVLEFQKSELEKANAHLGEMVMLDSLTGVKNRRALFDWLQTLFLSAGRYGESLAVILLDVDLFKRYNDAFGHLAGDDVLRRIASILEHTARESDMVARYGGEEFAIVCPKTDTDGALALAERIRSAIEQCNWVHRPVTASLGVASLTPATEFSEQLLANADFALYQSKELGRNRVSVYSPHGVGPLDAVAEPGVSDTALSLA